MSDSLLDAPASPIRVVLADDHEVVRAGLKLLIDAQRDMTVVGEASHGRAAWEITRALRPDVLIVDLSMPLMNGAEATERVRADVPTVKIIALTVHEERSYVARLLRAGTSGYVLKRTAAAELVRAVRVVSSGGTYIDPSVADMLVRGFLDHEEAPAAPSIDAMSERERDVLLRIARGFSNKEIAAELELSVKTVETYKARVTEKLGLRNRVDIVAYAARRGWLRER